MCIDKLLILMYIYVQQAHAQSWAKEAMKRKAMKR
jgi:hypothetical protein